jgi:hypothetical protein
MLADTFSYCSMAAAVLMEITSLLWRFIMASVLKRNGPKNSIVWQAQIRKKGYPSQIKTFDRKSDAQKWAKMIEHQDGCWFMERF